MADSATAVTSGASAVSESRSEGVAEDCKQRGNEHFKRGEIKQAVDAYSEAISLQPEEGTFWLNRAIARRQLEQWGEAEHDARRAIELQPTNAKAYFNRGVCLQKLRRLSEALRISEAGLVVQADNKALLLLRHEVGVELRDQRRGVVHQNVASTQPEEVKRPPARRRSCSGSSSASTKSTSSAESRGMEFVNARFGKYDPVSSPPPKEEAVSEDDGFGLELYSCAKAGDLEKCKELVSSRKEAVNWRKPVSGNTAMHAAAEEGHVNIVRLLVAAGADTEIINKFGLKPVCLAPKGTQAFKVLDKLTARVGELRRDALKQGM